MREKKKLNAARYRRISQNKVLKFDPQSWVTIRYKNIYFIDRLLMEP